MITVVNDMIFVMIMRGLCNFHFENKG